MASETNGERHAARLMRSSTLLRLNLRSSVRVVQLTSLPSQFGLLCCRRACAWPTSPVSTPDLEAPQLLGKDNDDRYSLVDGTDASLAAVTETRGHDAEPHRSTESRMLQGVPMCASTLQLSTLSAQSRAPLPGRLRQVDTRFRAITCSAESYTVEDMPMTVSIQSSARHR